MTITINTDASFHPVFKVGAFAFWIVCEQGRIIHSGPLQICKNAQDAELQAIGNALHTILKGKFTDVKHIYINTDCKYGIEAVTKGKKMGGCLETVKKLHTIINHLIKKYDYSKRSSKFKKFISWRYVPAHTEGGNKRQWVNNRMDTLAKAALWESINQSKNK